ncbi:phytanoyl-CoA dioxygenase family protein [Paenibacillus nasutitermitis]|uniref:Phytanoyl-CoA dioxygenase n=1 Tax=Paenibacillus nasutitermitis TaxID=1652958 RepID=A0A917DNH9_9BACL|nr:phytanoyl-CoA dioxygenase family protein [Paenibacillus nasutitermitis]GGD51072.1 phytanoyl-CoA dioxygenase [Paenibacillus nasutitermitis]
MSDHNPLRDTALMPASRMFEDATPLLEQPEKLLERANEKGYLFFKGFFSKESIIQVRKAILMILQEQGLLDARHPLMSGYADQEALDRLSEEDANWNGVGVPYEVYLAVQKLEIFHAMTHDPKLLALYETLFGARAIPHPRNIARVMVPHRFAHATPPHQDFLHIQGDYDTWTCWIPLGDVSRELGGLSILEGSHKAGLLGVTSNPGAGGLESILCGLGCEWAEGDYETGDFVTFHSLTVHKALPNQQPGRVRLSCDFRFQSVEHPIEHASLLPHGPFTWEELYEGWQREDLQYYWQQEKFEYTTFDESIRWQKDKIC